MGFCRKTILLLIFAPFMSVGWGQDCADGVEVELWGVCYDIETTTSIYLYNSGLTGAIPPEIGTLTNLTDLRLSSNQLTGEIPVEICNQGYILPYLTNNQLCPPYPGCLSEVDIGYQNTTNCVNVDLEATLSFGEVDLASQTIAIHLENSAPVSGFQFGVTGLDLSSGNISGGSAEANGFDVTIGGNDIVLGYSNTTFASEIPIGNDVLTYIEFDGFTNGSTCNPICFYEGVITSGYGNPQYFDVSYGDCILLYSKGDLNLDGTVNVLDIVQIVNIIFETSDPDACQIWAADLNSDGEINIMDIVQIVNIIFPDDCLEGYDCSGQCGGTLVNDCSGQCDGTLVYDECGVCGGDGVDDDSDGICDDIDDCIGTYDCSGQCDGPLVNDECGVCDGDGSSCGCDYDGNCYEVVQIGAQLWMAENLKVTHYNDGSEIPNITNNGDWGSLSAGAYGVYNNDPLLNADIYGNLYNWYTVDDDRGVCPAGWHVPSDEEFKELEMFLGMSESEANDTGYRGTDEGSKLAGNSGLWNDGNLENNSEFGTSGFTAHPGGYRSYSDGTYHHVGVGGYFWSSSESSSTDAWYRILYFNNSSVTRYDHGKQFGSSIRCLGD